MRAAGRSFSAAVRALRMNSRAEFFILAFAVVVSAVIIIGAVFSILTTRAAAVSAAERNLQRLADILASQVERSFLSVEASQKLIADKLAEHGINTRARLDSI